MAQTAKAATTTIDDAAKTTEVKGSDEALIGLILSNESGTYFSLTTDGCVVGDVARTELAIT
jgi:hypothetical protein